MTPDDRAASPAVNGHDPQEVDRLQRTQAFGALLFIVALSVLFVSSVVGVVVIWLQVPAWRAEGLPDLPRGLWFSTLLILGASAAVHYAWNAVRKGRAGGLVGGLAVTLALGTAFLVCQGMNWAELTAGGLGVRTRSLYGFSVYLLTGLHAAHVLGGLILLGVVMAKAARGTYHARFSTGPYMAMVYWHFLDAVWLVVFFLLLVIS